MCTSALRKHRQDIMDFKMDFKTAAISYQQVEIQCKEEGKNTHAVSREEECHLGALGSTSQWVREGVIEEGRPQELRSQCGLGQLVGTLSSPYLSFWRGERCSRGSESQQQCEPWYMHE